jgi:tripartite-type tricarboxylate transporter receptor subunit TctC
MARAKAQPGKLNYGAGTITAQLMGHLFHKAAGLDIVYVPFKGTPETVNGLLTGSVELIYAANQIVAPLIVGGQVRALAKLDRDAPPSMADIPTLAEAAGLPDLEDISVWLGLVAPKGTPKPIIEKIHAEVAKVLTDPAVKEKSEQTGNYPVINTPEQGGKALGEGDQGSRHQVRLREGRHDPSLDRAYNRVDPGDGNGRRAGAAGCIPHPLDQDRRALPGWRSL